MSKSGYLIGLLAAVVMFNSCVNKVEKSSYAPKTFTASEDKRINKSYGAYIAGRVAHLRKDFNSAADYYMETLKTSPDNNPELVSRVYLILTSKGRIDEAAKYAELSLKNGDKNSFTQVIIATNQMKTGQYKDANQLINSIDGAIYKEFISPLVSAWAYAGDKDQKNALKTLEILKKEPSFRALYNFHAGMINDYFGNNTSAQKHYEVIVNEESLEMSFRALQVITNFYIRTGQKNKAIALASKYGDEKVLADMMLRLKEKIADADETNTQPIITDANVGNGEALFSIAATLRQGNAGVDLAHMFISLSIYENPKYDLAKLLLADILESREMYSEANTAYDSIDKDSEAYYTAQLKKANNLVIMQDYKGAELLMKTLALDTNGYQLYLDLGDVLRISGKQKEAIEYYNEAIKNVPEIQNQHWVLYYALGISYEQSNNWDEAEKSFEKALELSQNHYLVQNYLAYSWLKQGKNIDVAFSMLADAYMQAPHEGNIADSLGWAFYKLGRYNDAVIYLEKASELEPAAAVISDHLGDAYWANGRKNEALFQWNHALVMKDEVKELDKDNVRDKIENGFQAPTPLPYDKAMLEERIKSLSEADDEPATEKK